MASTWHFAVFILVSLVAFVGMLLLVLHRRSPRAPTTRVLWVAGLVVIGGMEFARMGITVGLPVWVYYGVPLALLVAPTIHILFSFILGWKEYIPFMHVPSVWELIAS